MDVKPKAVSLFSGIGGIDLAFAAAGFDITAQVEIDPYCREVLKRHAGDYWPNAAQFTDVRAVGADELGEADVIFGGFPCQDISIAGNGAGLAGEQSGLWYEFRRIIGEVRPRFVFLENVPAITFRGGAEVVGHLAALGYDARWGIVAASDAGAPHRRERWWCVWVTATVMDTLTVRKPETLEANFQRHRPGRTTPPTLREHVQYGNMQWPATPAASDWKRGPISPQAFEKRHSPTLPELLTAESWPTPRAHDGGNGNGLTVSQAQAQKRITNGFGLTLQQRTWAETGAYLNPEWVEMLMGYPPGWTLTASPPAPARSIRGSRRAKWYTVVHIGSTG